MTNSQIFFWFLTCSIPAIFSGIIGVLILYIFGASKGIRRLMFWFLFILVLIITFKMFTLVAER
jgi:hypothetical protein